MNLLGTLLYVGIINVNGFFKRFKIVLEVGDGSPPYSILSYVGNFSNIWINLRIFVPKIFFSKFPKTFNPIRISVAHE